MIEKIVKLRKKRRGEREGESVWKRNGIKHDFQVVTVSDRHFYRTVETQLENSRKRKEEKQNDEKRCGASWRRNTIVERISIQ